MSEKRLDDATDAEMQEMTRLAYKAFHHTTRNNPGGPFAPLGDPSQAEVFYLCRSDVLALLRQRAALGQEKKR